MTAPVPDEVLSSYQKWEPGECAWPANGRANQVQQLQWLADTLRQDLKRVSAELLQAREALRGCIENPGCGDQDCCPAAFAAEAARAKARACLPDRPGGGKP